MPEDPKDIVPARQDPFKRSFWGPRFLALSLLALLTLPLYARAQTHGIQRPTSFAFTHVTLIDMTGVVTGNRIASVGPSRITRPPRGALPLDATGKFLIPGLWDMHVHAAWPRHFRRSDRELALLVEAGLAPMEALQAATRNPAIFLKATDSLGTIETGKLADLVLLDADPIADIHNTTRINTVVLDGQVLDPAARQRLLDFVRLEAAIGPQP